MNQKLIGIIQEIKKAKIRKHWPNCSSLSCQKGCRFHQNIYKAKVIIENKPIKLLSVVNDKLVEKDKILKILENNEFIDKRYLFTCVSHFHNYYLLDLKELPNKQLWIKN